MSVASSAAYYDFHELSSLRAQAVQAPGQALRDVAGQFESLFMQMMVKSMREATIDGGLFSSNQMDTYQSMLDQQMSLHLSGQGALGLADILVDQLEGVQGQDTSAAAEEQSVDETTLATYFDRAVPAMRSVSAPQLPVSGGEVRPAVPVSDTTAPASDRSWLPESAQEFVRDVWDQAVAAAGKLGLDPQVLVAQSALETGWGKRVIQSADGGSSFNLFGIKASGNWQGDSVAVGTLEYRDGVAAREQANFRVYDSIADSFSDYVDLLTSSPRYQRALESVADAKQFLVGLQEAGYATDPSYARKILDVMDSPALGSALAALKKF